jgi:hypothetical protein
MIKATLIGISGKLGSGKDTVGKIIQQEVCLASGQRQEYVNVLSPEGLEAISKWEIKKYAGKLKQIASILTGIPVRNLEDDEVKKSILPPMWNYYVDHLKHTKLFNSPFPIRTHDNASQDELYAHKMTVRQLLQELGTDAMRDKVHPNVWINALFADYKPVERRTIMSPTPNQEMPNWIITDLRFQNELAAVKDRGGITIRVDRDSCAVGTHISETELDAAEFDFKIKNNYDMTVLRRDVKYILKQLEIIPSNA